MRHKAAEKILADIAWHVANIVFALDYTAKDLYGDEGERRMAKELRLTKEVLLGLKLFDSMEGGNDE